MAVAIFYTLLNNYKKPFLFDASRHFKDGKIHLELAEDVTFINKASIQRTLNELPDNTKVQINASKTINLDHDVYEIIREFEENAPHRNIEVEIIDLESPAIKNQFHELKNAFKNNSNEGNRSA